MPSVRRAKRSTATGLPSCVGDRTWCNLPRVPRNREAILASRRAAETADKKKLAEAIAHLKGASPRSPELAAYVALSKALLKNTTLLNAYTVIAAQFTPRPEKVFPPLNLVDVMVRAARLKASVKRREEEEVNAAKIISAATRALSALGPIGKLEDLLIKEATAAADRTANRTDWDLEPPNLLHRVGEGNRLRMAIWWMRRVIEDREDINIVRRERLYLKYPGSLGVETSAALRDLVESLRLCAPNAKQSHVATLATAVLAEEGVTITPEQVKTARGLQASW
jgi:hypothetical protein